MHKITLTDCHTQCIGGTFGVGVGGHGGGLDVAVRVHIDRVGFSQLRPLEHQSLLVTWDLIY